jgi:hypothetical protein
MMILGLEFLVHAILGIQRSSRKVAPSRIPRVAWTMKQASHAGVNEGLTDEKIRHESGSLMVRQ